MARLGLRCRRALPLLLLWLCSVAHAGKPEPVVRGEYRQQPRDLVLILDTSGSMVKRDPSRLAIYAAKVFTDLAEAQDRVFVVPFPARDERADDGRIIGEKDTGWSFENWAKSRAVVGPMSAQELKARLEALTYSSQITVFREPLHAAIEAVSRAGGSGSRGVVIFSDGEPSRGVGYASHIFRGVAPILQKMGVRAFAVMLGDKPAEHFSILADATGGDVLRVARPEDLAERFAHVFSRLLETRAEPVRFRKGKVEKFEVRPYVKELILLVPGAGPDLALRFQEPRLHRWRVWESGRTLDSADPLARSPQRCGEVGVCRVDGQSGDGQGGVHRYTVLRIPQPRPGKWKVRLEAGAAAEARALLIQNFDVFLEVLGERERVGWVGEANRFEARLVNGRGEVVRDSELFDGANYSVQVRDASGQVLVDEVVGPDKKQRLVYDYLPTGTEPVQVRIALGNGEWLHRSVEVSFRGVQDIHLAQQDAVRFDELVPWTDAFIEGLGRGANLLYPLWQPGQRRTCTWVDFSGSAREAVGVVFQLDNRDLVGRHGARIVNEDGDPVFTVEEHAGGQRARVCLEAERWSRGGMVDDVGVPIRSSTGREVSGTTRLRVVGAVRPLPAVWAFKVFWIPIEGYIALRLFKGLWLWWLFGFSRRTRLRERMVPRRTGEQEVVTPVYPGWFGAHRIPVVPRLLSLPWYLGLSVVQPVRVAWVLLTWEYPLTGFTLDECVERPGAQRRRRSAPPPGPTPARKRRLALKALVGENLWPGSWMGVFWYPSASVREIVVTRYNGRLYFAETGGGRRAVGPWKRAPETLAFRQGESRFVYSFQ